MGAILVVLLLALLLAGAGFAVHVLWWIAVVVGIAWLAGFVFHSADNARWYHW